jgi:brefeldin A-resistance guanine nucleotide exchange factor 1
MRSFKTLNSYLSSFDELQHIDAVQYFEPFLAVIRYKYTSAPITGVALTSVHKFLMYDFLREDSPRAREAINQIADAAGLCMFEPTDAEHDEVVLFKLLELMSVCVRCPAGPLLSSAAVWNLIHCAFRISRQRGPAPSVLLQNAAEATMVHIVLSVFSRISTMDRFFLPSFRPSVLPPFRPSALSSFRPSVLHS